MIVSGRLCVSRPLLEEYVAYTQGPAHRKSSSLAELSPRQRQILSFLEHGLANKEMSLAMGISENTVKFHLSKLFSKVGVHDRHTLIYLLSRLDSKESQRVEPQPIEGVGAGPSGGNAPAAGDQPVLQMNMATLRKAASLKGGMEASTPSDERQQCAWRSFGQKAKVPAPEERPTLHLQNHAWEKAGVADRR
jgi:DNA-binding CsgD family transcriptional regulator